MRTIIEFTLTEALVLIMLFTGNFPSWVHFTIVVVTLFQIVYFITRLVKKYKAAKQAKP